MEDYSIVYRLHAIERMVERNVSTDQLDNIIKKGKIIEKYKNDSPFSSRLILGEANKRPLHVVITDNTTDKKAVVITVYEPDPQKWINNDERR